MTRGKKFKYLMFVGLALALVASLVAGACAPAAPEEAEKVEFETQRWEPSSWVPAGIVWDNLVYLSDYVTEMSDGRLVLTPSAPGGVAPVDEQLDAVAAGTTEAMSIAPAYYTGKIPVFFWYNDSAATPRTIAEIRDLYEFFKGGRITKIIDDELAKYGDVVNVANAYYKQDVIWTSNVPIRGIADVEGVMFRTAGLPSPVLDSLGAGTMWAPGDEMYTMLATGVVDAVTYDSVVTMTSMSIHEVTKYWIKEPKVARTGSDLFVVNGTVWNGLGDDLKAILKAAIEASVARGSYAHELEVGDAWQFVKDFGIEVIEWSEEDILAYAAAMKDVLWSEYRTDSSSIEYSDILEQWAVERGIWK